MLPIGGGAAEQTIDWDPFMTFRSRLLSSLAILLVLFLVPSAFAAQYAVVDTSDGPFIIVTTTHDDQQCLTAAKPSSSVVEEKPAEKDDELEEDSFELVVQVNGKVRGRVNAPKDASKDTLEALAVEAVEAQLSGKERVKTVVVPGRLVNFVVKG